MNNFQPKKVWKKERMAVGGEDKETPMYTYNVL
jgi:hypothetical protein